MEHEHDLNHPDSPLMTMTHTFLRDGMLQLSIPGPSRDPTYYIGDGNSVLLVENTLFKVHRSVLTKDKSAFEGMFQLSTETDSARSDCSTTGPTEGESDDNPIRLQGDSADEFRALLWSLYALPHELMLATTPDANCTQLLRLARVAHKYQFRAIEAWALSALHTFFARPGALDALPTADAPGSTPSLLAVTELAALCERGDMLELASARWKRLVGEGKDLALAIDVGERLNIRSVLGLAYHGMMLRGRVHWDTELGLGREQKIRLVCGYYNLLKFWEALPAQPPPLAHSARCTSQQRCSKAWGALWKTVLELGTEIIPGLAKEDILARMNLAESTMKGLVDKEVQPQGILDGLPHCKESALYATTVKVREFKESLPDYYSDEL